MTQLLHISPMTSLQTKNKKNEEKKNKWMSLIRYRLPQVGENLEIWCHFVKQICFAITRWWYIKKALSTFCLKDTFFILCIIMKTPEAQALTRHQGLLQSPSFWHVSSLYSLILDN